jgi:hypothetical protein
VTAPCGTTHSSSRTAVALALALAAAAAFAGGVPRPALAAPPTGAASALLALPNVGVRVEEVTPSLEETGVTRARLDSLVTARLAEAKVPSLRAADGAREGVLAVHATYVVNSGWHIVSLSLYFTRSAALEAEPTTIVKATVWSRGAVVIARKKKLWQEVERALGEQVGEFTKDYNQANH